MNMIKKRFKRPVSYISEEERRRRKREGITIVLIMVVVGLLTFAESRIIHFGTGLLNLFFIMFIRKDEL